MGRQLPEIFDVFVFFENEIFGNTLSLRSYVSAVFRSEGGEHRREGVPSVKQLLLFFYFNFFFFWGGASSGKQLYLFYFVYFGSSMHNPHCSVSIIINNQHIWINDIVIV